MSTSTHTDMSMNMTANLDDRTNGLLSWQWSLYKNGHGDRTNLLVHALTVPLFLAGTVALLASPVLGLAWAAGGVASMVVAIAAQGRGHKRETVAPVPFRGPLDVIVRLFLEQWITFPRFVLSGGFGRAWSRNASEQA